MAGEMRTFGVASKGMPDIAEHAVLETLRMQMLQLGAIEDGFDRIHAKEEDLEQLDQAVAQEADNHVKDHLLNQAAQKKNELEEMKNGITGQLKELEPQRSLFVAKNLTKCCEDLYQLSVETRESWEALRDGLREKDWT
ncbi:unnamed protein product [Aphanomyces euteiches]